jgi:hypothetical protein
MSSIRGLICDGIHYSPRSKLIAFLFYFRLASRPPDTSLNLTDRLPQGGPKNTKQYQNLTRLYQPYPTFPPRSVGMRAAQRARRKKKRRQILLIKVR